MPSGTQSVYCWQCKSSLPDLQQPMHAVRITPPEYQNDIDMPRFRLLTRVGLFTALYHQRPAPYRLVLSLLMTCQHSLAQRAVGHQGDAQLPARVLYNVVLRSAVQQTVLHLHKTSCGGNVTMTVFHVAIDWALIVQVADQLQYHVHIFHRNIYVQLCLEAECRVSFERSQCIMNQATLMLAGAVSSA